VVGVLLISTLPADSHWLPDTLSVQIFSAGTGAAAAGGAAEIATAAAPAANSGAIWIRLMRMATLLTMVGPNLEWNLAVRLCSYPSPPLDSWSTAAPCQEQAPSPRPESPSGRHPNLAGGAGTPMQGIAASGDRLPQPRVEKHPRVSVQKMACDEDPARPHARRQLTSADRGRTNRCAARGRWTFTAAIGRTAALRCHRP
jgi:hypothetical protein